MNDLLIIGLCFAIVIFCMVCYFLFNIYRGVYDSLTNAVIGSVYNFRYFQPVTGDYHRYLAKVINMRILDKNEISRLNYYSNYRVGDNEFRRSPTLVTCKMSNGDIRQFYAERSDMCRRSLVGNLLFKFGLAHLF